jgi:hypothetical protein
MTRPAGWHHIAAAASMDFFTVPTLTGRLGGMGITEVVSAPASPWQNPYVERLIGSIRRACLDHVIVINETHLTVFPAHPRPISTHHARASRLLVRMSFSVGQSARKS